MPMELIRRPRAARMLMDEITSEVESSYEKLADEIIRRLQKDIASWAHQPVFSKDIAIHPRKWQLTVSFDITSEEGEIYNWVDKGTGTWLPGGKEYDIFPINADALHFQIPGTPKSVVTDFGIPGVVLQDATSEANDVFAKHVSHPGIKPREFTKSIKKEYSSRTRIGGFRSVTERSIKRGLRKIGKQ